MFLAAGKLAKRAVLWPFVALFIFVTLGLLYHARGPTDREPSESRSLPKQFNELDLDFIDYPPTYKEVREAEWNLPQHNLDLPFPEGKNGRFVKFSCEISYLGWNNVLNERCVRVCLLIHLKLTRSFI